MTDRFRQKYVPLTDANRGMIDLVKGYAQDIADAIELEPGSREASLALTALEEAVMWATKHFSAPERQ